MRRYFDMPDAIAMVAGRSRTVLYETDAEKWSFATGVMQLIGKEKNLGFR